MRTIALIPAYQPDAMLVSLTVKLIARGMEVVVVDDGSDEGCAPIFRAARRCGATVLTHLANKGKGAALRTGLAHIASAVAPPYVVVSADADGQHRAADIERVAAAAAAHPDGLALGVRTFEGDVPLRSRVGNGATALIFRRVTGVGVSDTQTGLRAFRDRHVSWMRAVEGDRYEYEMAMLTRWALEGRPLCQVRIATIYLDSNRSSHFAATRDARCVCRALIQHAAPRPLRFAATSLASFAIDYTLFCLLHALGLALGLGDAAVMANVAARLVSATVNFALNKTYVFENAGAASRAAPRYALLAGATLMVNTLLLRTLVAEGMATVLAKPCVEVMMFFLSYTIQQLFVFKGQGQNRKVGADHDKKTTGGYSLRRADSSAHRIPAA